MRKSLKEIEYITFILGYDLLHTAFENSGNPETDVVFNRCLDIANDFYKSEYKWLYLSKFFYAFANSFIDIFGESIK